MVITRFHHHPDIFLTMTANPRWPEIQDALLSRQYASDRPDLIACVFEMKRVALMKEIKKGNVFGTVVAHVHTVEFQKRGLPHMHALIFLDGPEKIHTIEQVDKFVSAEFPDEETDPVLFETVRKCMVHGPCGPDSMCMKNGRCSRGYPKKILERTSLDEGGYPIHHRRHDGKEVIIRKGFKPNNTNVVSYNRYLSRMFNCHINVEVCGGVRAVKYIHKYIYNGHDRETLIVGGCDEVQQYIDARYIGPLEAAWRLYGKWMHEEEPTVVRLAIHLPGQQRFVYDPNNPIDTVSTAAENYKSTLMAYFDYYCNNPTTKAYTYQDFPQHFRWNKGIDWTSRKRGFAIARMYWVSPNACELYYLRLLLTVVAGASSFDNLETVVDGKVRKQHRTFKAACIALGILGDDREWFKCLEEEAVMKTGVQLRKLFKIILRDCNPTQPDVLWSKFGLITCDDLHFKIQVKYNIRNPTDEQVLDYGLYLLDNQLLEYGKSLEDFEDMPRPQLTWSDEVGDKFIWEHRCLQLAVCSSEVDKNIKKLNPAQLSAYNSVIDSVKNVDGKLFFLNGIVGSGKTFLYNTLASSCRRDGHIVLTTASSGIASLLLVGGLTAHSTFRIPIEINETSVCGLDKQDPQSKLLEQVKLIIWDEVPM
ncbi:uncharacterized protein LOC113298127 [Papaver somniferum]|uniref:uncharacterized protein LOC113298127 n=1 Tax=Papaver somniferum TaxID=3469 RepID=UPI000E700CEE|nr:uncharacterized protein LOC113298127 [Papaver somniferum]XP_026402587.1 uncharacterized protein LOC113298127 [Papaver somniferum]